MKILILGAKGMLGHMACRVFGRHHEVHATGRSPEPPPTAILPPSQYHGSIDTTDEDRPRALLRELRPDVVFNCVGLIKQKGEARDPIVAIETNALLPHRLADACDEIGTKLLQPSTDCVFSGRAGHYRENDLPDPPDLYGRSKLLGEVERAPHLTFRTSIIGRQLQGQESLVEWFTSQRGGRASGYRRAIFSGLTTQALCETLEQLLARDFDLHGLWHIASQPISKLELLSRLNEMLDLSITMEIDDSLVIDRSLNGTAFEQRTGIRVPSWDRMLQQLKEDWGNYEDWRDRP